MTLRVLDLFAGAGGFTLAGEMAGGYSTVAFCEIDKHAQKVLVRNWPDVAIFDDVTKLKGSDIGAVDVIAGGFPCFTAGTLVNTERGIIPIEEVSVGDRALTHRGRYMPVVQVMSRDNAPTFEMKVMGAPTITATDEHPFYVLRNGYPEWVRLRDIVRGDLVATPTSDEEVSDKDFDPYLLGRWLGDGWVVRYKRSGRKNSYASRVHWCCSRDEEDGIEFDFARAGYSVTKDQSSIATKYVRQDAKLATLLDDFGSKAHGKKIPNWVYSKPIEWRLEFLRGYEDSDGNKRNGGVCYTTVSKALAVGVARLIRETFGRVARIHEYHNARQCIIDGRTVNERKVYQVVDGRTPNKQAVFSHGRWWVPVRYISATGKLDTVYNFGVNEDESYVADGIVCHNCQDLSSAGRGAGIGEGTRSGLFREMLRLACEVREITGRLPYIIFENVPRLLSGPSENPGEWFGEFLWSLAEVGYDAEWFCITAASIGAPHQRERVCVVAYANEDGWQAMRGEYEASTAESSGRNIVGGCCEGMAEREIPIHGAWETATYPNEAPIERGCISSRVYEEHANIDGATGWWGEWGGGEPEICGVDDGVSKGSYARRNGIMGNAIVPQVFAMVMKALREAHMEALGE